MRERVLVRMRRPVHTRETISCSLVDRIHSHSAGQERDWTDYWKLLFPKVTVENIKSFELTYKGSEEEAEDLKRAYMQHEGDMDRIMTEVGK